MTTILVADHDGGTRDMLQEVLTQEGYTVITAPDGHTALAHVMASNTPLVVLLDELLPGLTGREVVNAYRAGTPASRHEFILLAMNPEATPLTTGLPVLAMPFGFEELLEAIAHAAARLEER
jgi:CheY-like chemotaxis protein